MAIVQLCVCHDGRRIDVMRLSGLIHRNVFRRWTGLDNFPGPRGLSRGELPDAAICRRPGTVPGTIRRRNMSRKIDRRYFIGGSDARVIMGDDEANLVRLWREKRGEIAPED